MTRRDVWVSALVVWCGLAFASVATGLLGLRPAADTAERVIAYGGACLGCGWVISMRLSR